VVEAFVAHERTDRPWSEAREGERLEGDAAEVGPRSQRERTSALLVHSVAEGEAQVVDGDAGMAADDEARHAARCGAERAQRR
jgi:hypothetical protein